MVTVMCQRGYRRAQILLPPIAARLRCESCNEVRVFGSGPRFVARRVGAQRMTLAANAIGAWLLTLLAIEPHPS
jgi:hypothetical protein